MKKFINILLCAAIILSSCFVTAFANEAVTAPSLAPVEAGLLAQLGIMSSGGQEGFWDKGVTRGEFAKYVYNIAKSRDHFERSSYYTDVAKGSELEAAVNYLVKTGILTIPENRLFRADDYITYNEVCKMLVVLAGYEPYVQHIGGYPAGYLTVAKELEITDNIEYSEIISSKTAAMMIYNALHAGIYDFKTVTLDGPEYTGKNTETVMENFFDIYIVEGEVTKKNMTDLKTESGADKGIIEIDGVLYNDLIENEDILGYDVKAFVLDNEVGKDSVVYAEISSRNKIIEIDAKDIIDVSANEVIYYDKNGREKSARLSNAVFVKNGSVIGYDISQEAEIRKGKITLLSSTGKSTYNTVLITEYEIFVVGMLDSTNRRIYDKYDRASHVDFDENKLESVVVLLNGDRVNFMHIEDGDVLTVKRSADGKFVTAAISNEIVKGTVESIGGRNSDLITVDGKEYTLDSVLAKRLGVGAADKKAAIVSGDTVELVFDLTGEVADIRKTTNDTFKTGYVHDMDVQRSGLASDAGLAIYTLDGENKIFYLEDKISINDGKRNSTYTDVFNLLGKDLDKSMVKPQLIRFAVNSEDKIYAINTADYSSSMGKSRYIKRVLEENLHTYRSNLVYPITAINDETVILQVPTDTVIESGNAYEHYFAKIPKSTFKTGAQYTLEAYNINDNDPYTDVLIYKRALPSDDSQYDTAGIVRRISKMIDGFDNEVYAIELFEKGKGVKHITSTECIWKDANKNDIAPGSIQEGDMIRYNFDGAGSIAYIKLLYRPSDLVKGETLSGTTGAYDARFRVTCYYAADKYEGAEMDSGGILSLVTFSDEMGGEADFRMQYSRLNKAIVYDSTKREGDRVFIGNIDNIVTYEGTGGADASIVLTQATIGTIQTFYIIN